MNGAIYRKDGKWLVDNFPKADLIEDLALFWTFSSCIFVAGGCDCVYCPVVKLTFTFVFWNRYFLLLKFHWHLTIAKDCIKMQQLNWNKFGNGLRECRASFQHWLLHSCHTFHWIMLREVEIFSNAYSSPRTTMTPPTQETMMKNIKMTCPSNVITFFEYWVKPYFVHHYIPPLCHKSPHQRNGIQWTYLASWQDSQVLNSLGMFCLDLNFAEPMLVEVV